MDTDESYAWGELFTSDWPELAAGMAERATAMGLTQEERAGVLIWNRAENEECRWVFVEDPSDLASVRAVYADSGNTGGRSCYVVVRQHDPSDTRGDVIFDIFRLSPQSYLWHFNRVFTRPPRDSA